MKFPGGGPPPPPKPPKPPKPTAAVAPSNPKKRKKKRTKYAHLMPDALKSLYESPSTSPEISYVSPSPGAKVKIKVKEQSYKNSQ